MRRLHRLLLPATILFVVLAGCAGEDGADGSDGPAGPAGDPGDTGDPGDPGLACWDLDANGTCDLGTEDANGDGACSALDCQGGTATAYAGTAACAECHADIADSVFASGHPHKLTKVEGGVAPTMPYDSVTGGIPDPPLGLSWSDISYVIGGFGWKARYVGTDGYIVTGTASDTTQYNFPNPDIGTASGWVAYHAGETKAYDCGGCHTTGWIPCPVGDTTCEHQDGMEGMAGSFEEPGVSCEACHGPSAAHAAAPYLVEAHIDRDAEMCGQCHRRGTIETIDAKGGFISHHEQWEEMFQSKKHVMSCIDCHDPHKSSKFSDPVDNPTKGMRLVCEACHFGYDANQKSTTMQAMLDCIDCHMPRVVKSAVAVAADNTGDIRSHLFAINPDVAAGQFSIDGTEAMPYLSLQFACNGCHGVTATVKSDGELEALATGYHQ